MKRKKTIISIIIGIIIINTIIFLYHKNNNELKKNTTTAIPSSSTVKTSSTKETKNKEVLLKFSKLLTDNSFLTLDFLNSQTLTINIKNPQVINNHIMVTGYYTTSPNSFKKEYQYNIYAEVDNSFKIIESYKNIQEKIITVTIDQKNKSKYGGYNFKYSSSHIGILQFGKINEYPFYNGIYNNQKITILNMNTMTGNNKAYIPVYNNKFYSVSTPDSVNLDLNNIV